MEFDKSKVYTALNADELKVGSKVIVASNIVDIKNRVTRYYEENITGFVTVITDTKDEKTLYRFIIDIDIGDYADNCWPLAYLVEAPEEKKLKWTDLKVGDVITNGNHIAVVTEIYKTEGYKTEVYKDDSNTHIYAGAHWISDNELEDWEKVEE